MQARFDEALECLYKALDINNAIGEFSHANIIKVYIGSLLHDGGDSELGLSYQKEAEEYFLESKEDDKLLFVYMERGAEYKNLGEYDLAIADLTKGIEVAERMEHIGALANLHELLGDVYVAQGRAPEAEAKYLTTLRLCERMDIPYGIASAHSRLSELYMNTGDLGKALESALVQDRLSSLHDLPRLRLIAKKRLSQIYFKTGKFDLAYREKVEEYALRDSLDQEERAQALDEIREKYESEKNLREVERLKNEAELERVKRNGLVLGLGLLLFLSIIIINREVQRRTKARALHRSELEVERLENLRLEETLRYKNRELNSLALNIAQKNDLLEGLKKDLRDLQYSGAGNGEVTDMVNKLRISEQIEGNWDEFTKQFIDTNPSFYKGLTEGHPGLTKNDVRLAALLRMNLSSKDISRMLNISDEGVKKARYRLRKKLELQKDDSLEGFILSI
jgi:tetratricopeptide (TPR) repeat protein